MTRREMAIALLLFTVAFVFAIVVDSSCAHGQDVDTDLATITRLDLNERAPHAGLLLHEGMVVRYRLEIESLQYRLEREVAAAEAVCTERLVIERAHTTAARAETALRDSLWQARAEQLAQELATAQGQRGPAWYEAPALWFTTGAVVAVVVVIAIAAALGGG